MEAADDDIEAGADDDIEAGADVSRVLDGLAGWAYPDLIFAQSTSITTHRHTPDPTPHTTHNHRTTSRPAWTTTWRT